ncbi:MAG: tetratricopeptide repeat protein [Chitinophagales bacterium]
MSSTTLLNVTQAAIHLGITKALLMAYVRNSPKVDGKKLNTIVKDGINYFKENELDEFNNYLKEPWAQSNEPRPAIPSYIQEYLHTESNGECTITGKGYPLENAHITPYAECRNHHHHNLIRIYKGIHGEIDGGTVSIEELHKRKNQLIEILRQRLRQEKDSYRASFLPPKPHPFFVGREQALIELTHIMEFERVVVIEGIGGIGKTQLLLQTLDNVKYHVPLVWIDIESLETLDDLILQMSNAITELTGQVVTDSLVNALRDLHITIALDSFEKLLISYRDKAEDFISALMNQTEKVQLLITTQVDISLMDVEKTVLKLEGIEPEASQLILQELSPEEIALTAGEIEWFVKFSGGHPLSLKIISGLLRFYKSAKRVMKQLQRNDSLKQPMRQKHNKKTALSICLSLAYESLTSDQRGLLHIAKFYPGGVKLRYLEESRDSLYEDVAVLEQFFFARRKTDATDFERLFIANPVEKFLFDKASVETEDKGVKLQREQLINIMIEANVIAHHYIESALKGPTELGVIRMESEFPNILRAFWIATKMIELVEERKEEEFKEDYFRVVAGIAGALGKFCFIRGYFRHGIKIAKEGIRANIELGEISSASTQYVYLAQLQLRQYDLEAFENTCEELCQLAKSSNETSAIRDCHWMKGRVARDKGEIEAAIKFFKEAKSLLLQKYENERGNKEMDQEIVSVSSLGNLALLDSEIAHAFADNGNFQDAITYYTLAIENQKKINDDTNLYSCYHQLANCLIQKGDMSGLEYYFKAIEGFKRTGQLEYLGNSFSELGRFVLERPELAQHDLLNEEAFSLVLHSLSYQVNEFLSRHPNNPNPLDQIPFDLSGKAILIMKLISFTDHAYLLFDWAEGFRNKIDPNLKLSYFSAFLNVAHLIGGVVYSLPHATEKDRVMKYLLQGVLILNGGPDLKSQTFIFYWLAAWMRHTKFDKNASAEVLLQAAWDSFEE